MFSEQSTKMLEKLDTLAQQEGLSANEMLDTLITQYNHATIPPTKSNQAVHQFQQAQLFKGLFEQSVDAVFLLDMEGNHIDCNQRACDLLGYPKDILMRASYHKIVKPDEQTQSINMLERLVGGEILPPYQRIFIHKNGEEIPVELNVECVFDDDNQPLYIQSIARDIREREFLVQQLKTNEALLRTIFDAMAEGLVIHIATGAIIRTNPMAHELLGLTSDQLRGLTPISPNWRTIHEDSSPFPGDTHPASISLQQGIEQRNVVMGVYKPDNSLTWLSINSVPVFTASGDIETVIVTFTNITALKAAQQQAIDMAVEQQRASVIANFIRDARHEFRTPLTVIMTNTHLLRRDLEETGIGSRRIQKIDEQSLHIQHLVDDLALMAKLDATATLNLSTIYDIHSYVMTIKERMAHKLGKRHLKIDAHARNAYVATAENYLYDILVHILDNAIRYSSNDSPVTMTTQCDNSTVTITISDEGIGISPEDMPFIMQRFWRKDVAHSDEGFGLGLPIANRLIELHNGTIDVMSTENEGTTVTITLPRVSA